MLLNGNTFFNQTVMKQQEQKGIQSEREFDAKPVKDYKQERQAIIDKMISEMPYVLDTKIFPYIREAMELYAEQRLSELREPSLPSSLKELLSFIDGDRVEINFYGNDGFDSQEKIDGKKHLKNYIQNAWEERL